MGSAGDWWLIQSWGVPVAFYEPGMMMYNSESNERRRCCFWNLGRFWEKQNNMQHLGDKTSSKSLLSCWCYVIYFVNQCNLGATVCHRKLFLTDHISFLLISAWLKSSPQERIFNSVTCSSNDYWWGSENRFLCNPCCYGIFLRLLVYLSHVSANSFLLFLNF